RTRRPGDLRSTVRPGEVPDRGRRRARRHRRRSRRGGERAHMNAPSGETRAPRLVAGRVVAGKYELVRPLGRGGMGEVWLARHRTLNTQVAIKFLGGDDPESGEQRARALERFHLE